MKQFGLLLWLALSATVLSGQSGDESAANQITIYTQFDHAPSAGSIDHMKIELDAIMAPLGLRFDWRSLEGATGHEVLAEIMVLSFKGTCQSNELISNLVRGGPLGWTHVSDGEVLPFADVDCDRIRRLIRSPMAVTPLPERDQVLGRAMARVVAHEMYHFFTNTTKHASKGIAKPVYTAVELACPHLEFEVSQLRQVRRGRLRNLIGAIPATSPAGGG